MEVCNEKFKRVCFIGGISEQLSSFFIDNLTERCKVELMGKIKEDTTENQWKALGEAYDEMLDKKKPRLVDIVMKCEGYSDIIVGSFEIPKQDLDKFTAALSANVEGAAECYND